MTIPAHRLALPLAACLASAASAKVAFTSPFRATFSTVEYASVFYPTFDVNPDVAADNHINTENLDPWGSESSSRVDWTDTIFIEGFAPQSSALKGQRFVFSGAARLEVGGPPPGCDFYTAAARSIAELTIETDEPVLIELSADQPYRTGDAEARVILGDYLFVRLKNAPSASIRRVIRLLPDLDNRLGLWVSADRAGFDQVHETALDATLTVLGPSCAEADISLPGGVLDLADIQAFVAAFQSADPLADIAEPEGLLDLADLQAFIASFLNGCD